MKATSHCSTFAPAAIDSVSFRRVKVGKSSRVAAPIVYGTDFSPNANAQAEVAAEFARRLDVPLVLAHSADLPRTLARDAKASRWIIAIRKRGLRKVATSLRESGLEIVEEVRPGSVAKTLAQVAHDRKAQLIIVSERRKRTGHWLRASTAARVAVKAHTPMLLFRETDALRGWLRGERPLKVFVAFNFSTTADAALRWVKKLTRVGPCEVVMGYVNQPIDDYIRIGARGPLPFDENPPEVLAVLERDMKARARAVLGDVPVRCRVAAGVGRTQVHLAHWAREENADLIVAGSRQSKGLMCWRYGSVSRALLKQSTVSVAIVPLAAAGHEPAASLPVKRHVLVATDLSAVGNAAVPHALALLPEGGLLTLMHVSTLPQMVSNHVRPDLARAARLPVAERLATSNRLRQLVPADAPARGILAQTEVVLAANVGEAIAQTGERLSVDAICLATAPRAGVSRAVLGSVTRTVRRLTRRPLLVVPVPRM